jgi:hypothetical protein
MKYVSSLAERFKEPSSWAGLAGIVALVGLNVDPGLLQAAVYVGAGLCGVIAFFAPEKA